MTYLVVAYPKISKEDYNWIQRYREENDPRYFSVVEPHFTIVFAVSDTEKDVFIDEVKKQAEGIKKFDFEINVATINQDDSGEYFHEFLVPDQGYSNIIKLHDKLYSGLFSKHLRLDIDFIPHIGIGNADSAKEVKNRIDNINSTEKSINGTIDAIDIIEYKGDSVETLDRVILK